MIFTTVIILAFGGLVLVALNRFTPNDGGNSPLTVNDFSSCALAGNLVTESFPRQCISNGKTFVESAPNGAPAQPPLIVMTAPAKGAPITSPTTIKGYARGYWYFEASFPVRIEDAEGAVIAVGPAQAQSEWMTEEYVPFSVTLSWKHRPSTATGTIVLMKDNPSGLPENDDSIRVPISFVTTPGTTRINVFFPNSLMGSDRDCRLVFPVIRDVPATTTIARVALLELLRGPNSEERSLGYTSEIPERTALNFVTLHDKTITADFNEELSVAVAGSCRVGSIRAQIEETLRQFPSVESVVIGAEGRIDDILQP
jgi:hypothetical protein